MDFDPEAAPPGLADAIEAAAPWRDGDGMGEGGIAAPIAHVNAMGTRPAGHQS